MLEWRWPRILLVLFIGYLFVAGGDGVVKMADGGDVPGAASQGMQQRGWLIEAPDKCMGALANDIDERQNPAQCRGSRRSTRTPCRAS